MQASPSVSDYTVPLHTNMAPKKKAKISAKAKGSVSGAKLDSELSPVLRDIRNMVEAINDLRHKTASDPVVMPKPVLHGGTFKDIMVRAWAEPSEFLSDSLKLCKACGLLDPGATLDEFGERFMRIAPWPPLDDFITSILCWCFEDHSFWRGKDIPQSEVIDKARTMSSHRFPEVAPLSMASHYPTMLPQKVVGGALTIPESSGGGPYFPQKVVGEAITSPESGG